MPPVILHLETVLVHEVHALMNLRKFRDETPFISDN